MSGTHLPARRHGQTMMELLTALIILGIVITLAVESFVFFHKAARRTEVRLEQLQTVNELLRHLRADVMRARTAMERDGALILGFDGGEMVYRYRVAARTIERQTPARSEAIAEGVSGLSFAIPNGSPLVCVRLRVGKRAADELVTIIALRNHSSRDRASSNQGVGPARRQGP